MVDKTIIPFFINQYALYLFFRNLKQNIRRHLVEMPELDTFGGYKMNIRAIICSVLFIMSISGWTQESASSPQQEEKTLLSTPVKHGIYAAPVLKFSSFGPEGNGSLIVGAQGGWILNHKYVVGLGVYGLSTRVKAADLQEIAGLVTIFNYGGLFLCYIHNSYNLVHVEVTTLIGVGEVNYRDEEYWAKYPNGDNFVVFEPGINAIINITPGFRAGAGLSYRYVDRLGIIGMETGDVSGINFNLMFQVGHF